MRTKYFKYFALDSVLRLISAWLGTLKTWYLSSLHYSQSPPIKFFPRPIAALHYSKSPKRPWQAPIGQSLSRGHLNPYCNACWEHLSLRTPPQRCFRINKKKWKTHHASQSTRAKGGGAGNAERRDTPKWGIGNAMYISIQYTNLDAVFEGLRMIYSRRARIPGDGPCETDRIIEARVR